MRRCEKRSVLENTQSIIDVNKKYKDSLELLIHKDMGPDLNRELRDCARLIGNAVFQMEILQKRVQREVPYEEALI